MDNPEPMDLGVQNRRFTFKEKWDLHKPLLGRLYFNEELTLPKIQQYMRSEEQFDAEIHQYKWQFKKWGWKKSIPEAKKAVLLEIGHKRALQGHDTSITHQGRALDMKKLLRYAKRRKDLGPGAVHISQAQASSSNPWAMANPLLGNRNVLYMWNLPYNALLQFLPQQTDRRSPDDIRSTPSDIEIISPSPSAVSSPVFSQAVTLNASRNRAKLFVSGKFDELLGSLGNTEKNFKTAKHWGRGPATWTASNLWSGDFSRFSPGFLSRSPTPSQVSNAPLTVAQAPSVNKRSKVNGPEPTALCRWSIHILQEKYDSLPEENSSFQAPDETNVEWPPDMLNASFEQKLQQSLETNSFSTINAGSLPVSAIDIAKAVKKSPEELFKQSFAFAVIGRNPLLVERLCEKAYFEGIDLSDVHPYHLATTYLDGARSCCHILQLFRNYLDVRPNIPGPTGYTVLDSLMITILRNHSTTLPETLDANLRGANRFGGDDVDICGRWDADSDCYQSLLRSGSGMIPSSWKHKFCHTSAKAVCHAMTLLQFNVYKCPESGIFMKRCFACGLKLQLPPMHTIVVTAFHLAQFGFRDEDLFGMICCVLCFIVRSKSSNDSGVDRAQVSTDMLLGDDSGSVCTHESLTAAQLAKKLASAFSSNVSTSTKLGWSVIYQILQQVEDQYSWSETGVPPAGYEYEHENLELEYQPNGEVDYDYAIWWGETVEGTPVCDHMEADIPRAFGQNRLLGHIWAACQCELLTYRRLRKEESWVSKRIDVSILANCLRLENVQKIPYIKEGLLQEYCPCGLFCSYYRPCTREEACTEYFSNLDDWNRTTFLDDEDMFEEL